MTKKLKVLDLFSGIGGFSLGLEKTGGFETVAFCEIDEACRKVLNKHWPDVRIIEDVKDLGNEWKFPKGIDVICGGFPCTDISIAGQKKGLTDEEGNKTRSGLWFDFARIIEEVRPRYVIIENVANLRNIGLTRVLQDLGKIGYDAEWHIISARSLGAPHLRERIWIIAYPNTNTKCLRQPERARKDLRPQEQASIRQDASNVLGEGSDAHSPNCNNLRLWKPFTSKEEKQKWWTKATSGLNYWEEIKSFVCGISNGISGKPHKRDSRNIGMDKSRRERIKQLGNSVVPQIPELIGRAILEYENDKF